MYDRVIWYFYTLQNDDHNVCLSPVTIQSYYGITDVTLYAVHYILVTNCIAEVCTS